MKKIYYSTHQFLIDQFCDLPDLYITYLLSKKQPVRKLQDKYCYIHSVINGIKVFTPHQHKKLETAIRNNLKFFSIEYVPALADSDIFFKMDQEAQIQKVMLKNMSFNSIIYNRIPQINYFLNYSFARSYDHFIKIERFSPEYLKIIATSKNPILDNSPADSLFHFFHFLVLSSFLSKSKKVDSPLLSGHGVI